MERPPMETALSTDVIMDIVLSYLKVGDLLNCRKVSKFWNKAASSVLRRRSTMVKNISKKKILRDLGECLQQSSDFPFAGLRFDQPWRLNSAGAMDFFKNYGERFTSLRLDTSWPIRLEDLAPFIHHLPQLRLLEAGWSCSRPPRIESLDSGAAAAQEDGRILSLPSLRIFRISTGLNEEVLLEVCTAASPSLRIECLDATCRNLRALKSAGMLQAVSVINSNEYEDEKVNALATLLPTESPALTKLDFYVDGFFSRQGLIKLLISSQQTLKELRLAGTYPWEFPSECPVLAKLTTFSLNIQQSYEQVFKGSHGHKFPALKELKLDTTYGPYDPSKANLSDALFIVPSLTTIDLDGYVNENRMEGLACSFPNVVEIRLKHNHYDFGSPGGSSPFEIWSVRAFKFLEKLRIWDYTVEPRTRTFAKLHHFKHFINLEKFKMMNMDSFLTGIPLGICENLRKHHQQNLNEVSLNEIFRDSPSLIQLKNLKELMICVKLGYESEALPQEPPFMSVISVWYALQMMPNLEAKFVYEYGSPSWGFVEQDRERAATVLEAAFKHVKPYVKLAPFFY